MKVGEKAKVESVPAADRRAGLGGGRSDRHRAESV